MTILLYILTGLLLISAQENVANQRKFPENFLFGTATASYQVEGAWNTSGKGQNIWDFLTQNTNLINDRSTGDIACDSYHLYPRDVEMLKELGVDYYRFSLSWSRILPTGFDYKINKEGIAYYNKLIDLLIANNIRPFVTLYHWDLPQPLQDIGGWSNPHIEKYFTAYSKVAFEHFGDRVKDWLTFNEPMEVCHSGYGSGIKAPAVKLEGIADYLCAQTLLMAHARVFHLYNDDFRPTQKGRIGITLNAVWAEPENPDLASDIQASDIDLQFEFGWFAHPIFSKSGDYPEVMKEKIALKSQEQGFGTSRLPTFTPDEVAFIRGTSDFLGINHYTSCLIKMADETVQYPVPSLYDDTGVTGYQPANWPGNPTVDWLKIVPWGLRKLLIWLKDNYNNPEIIITECGYGDSGGTNDSERVRYYHQYLNAMLDAMDQGVNVTSFIAWSLMDNFEWYAGYTQKFGLYEVDFHDPARPRKPKLSATFYSEIVKSKLITRV